jgi:hypothetical protein
LCSNLARESIAIRILIMIAIETRSAFAVATGSKPAEGLANGFAADVDPKNATLLLRGRCQVSGGCDVLLKNDARRIHLLKQHVICPERCEMLKHQLGVVFLQ